MNRKRLVDKLAQMYEKMYQAGLENYAADILNNNNASEDDSDPNEGYMITMSDYDLQNAITEMEQVYSNFNPDTVQSMIYALTSRTLDVTYDYTDGFLDACRMIVEEYGIPLEGLDN